MKKLSIILFLCVSVCNGIFASAAIPGPYLKIQPNGDSIYIYFNGDEHSRAFYTDGKRKEVARNGEGYWVYVVKINGKWFFTDQIVSKTSTFKEIDEKTVNELTNVIEDFNLDEKHLSKEVNNLFDSAFSLNILKNVFSLKTDFIETLKYKKTIKVVMELQF